ncbi:MAG TPA: hypothetical protein VFQ12_12090 [Thermoleophilaceae bacterium]|nr:hypothetical protein [Thermoleophilaceae bacterium]
MGSRDGFLDVVLNLARYHREHEKFYAARPLEDALALQRSSRALKALAERWSTVQPAAERPASPYAGAPELNDPRAIEAAGVLFMEGEGEPAEIGRLKHDLVELADVQEQTGDWLAKAMEAAWGVAEGLLQYPQLADLLGERHRIIANDWQAASIAQLVARQLLRARAILDRVDFSPQALRDDLRGDRCVPGYLFAASELLDNASDLIAQSASLVHENERRWRVFRERVELVADGPNATHGGAPT